MLRKIVSTTLLVSLLAIVSSGLLMMLLGSYEFNLRMHPVHKIFGMLLSVSGIIHVYLNFKSIKKYLTSRRIMAFAIIMFMIMVLLYIVGFLKPIDETFIREMESILSTYGGH